MADLCSQLHSGTISDHDRSNKLINLKLLIVATDKALWSKTLDKFVEQRSKSVPIFMLIKNGDTVFVFSLGTIVRAHEKSNTMANFYFIFKALEEELFNHKDDKYIWCLFIPELLRTKAFEEDLQYFFGENWSDVVFPSKATSAFVNHLHDVAKEEPLLLISYCHSFYLALMAGGQIIKKTITKSLGLKDGQGAAAFHFEEKTATQLKKQLKDAINNIDIDDDLKNQIIREKSVAYEMTNAIVREIKIKPSSFVGLMKLLFLFIILPLLFSFVVFRFLKRSYN